MPGISTDDAGSPPPSEPDPCDDAPEIGDVCLGGAIYAGMVSSGWRIFIAPEDEPVGLLWKTSNTPTPGASDNCDGLANTNAIAAAGLADHPAAQACRSRGPEWYLPSYQEFAVPSYNILRTTASFTLTGASTDYWASTEGGADWARAVNYWVVMAASGKKDSTTMRTRCFRDAFDGSAFCLTGGSSRDGVRSAGASLRQLADKAPVGVFHLA